MGRTGQLAIVILLIVLVLSASLVIADTQFGINSQESLSTSDTALSNSSQYYQATFSESGLTDKNWSVTLNGLMVNTTKESISFFLQPGNYSYMIGSPSGYFPSIKNGTITIVNQSVNIYVNFTRTSIFTFYEIGLPSGDFWTVVMNGTHYSSKNSSITIDLPQGYYKFSVIVPMFYSSSPATGTVGPGNSTVGLKVVHLPTEYIIVIAILVLVDAAIVYALMKRRKR
jgi:hypothetical protein